MGCNSRNRNRIKRGQFWRKRDTGQIIEIKRQEERSAWVTLRIGRGGSLNKSHTITAHDLLKYYDHIIGVTRDNQFIFEKPL